MKITKQELFSKGKKFFNEDLLISKDDVKDTPIILDIKCLHADVSVENISDISIVKIALKGNLVLSSTRSLKPVDYLLNTNDEIVFTLNNELVDDENVILFNDDELDLNPIFYSMLISSIPLKVIDDNDEFVKGEGYEVISEDEYNKRRETSLDNSLFSSLVDLDLDN